MPKMTTESPWTLLTDLYQLSMAAGYWKTGIHERRAVFQLYFRKRPFKGGYALSAGLADALEYLEQLKFSGSDLEFLATLPGGDGRPIFEEGFLKYLEKFQFNCDVAAIPEGTVVFQNEPLLRVEGPILQAQLVETTLLNIINFQTLIATKASRVVEAAAGEPVLEFGLRRAQGVDGALSAARAAYIGGCAATSNVLAGKRYGIPVRGTHAHSWVMAFASELEAFQAYASALPNNVILLVDTYDTIQGVRHAVEVGRKLKASGHKLAGIRLDSGDLAFLSVEARKILDQAGFTDTRIVASNDLDENIIESLKHQGARIDTWGVGTQLVTAFDQPALGGVYKLAAIQDEHGQWQSRIKLSEQAAKVSTPGVLQVRRYHQEGRFIADSIHDRSEPPESGSTIVDPMDPLRRREIELGLAHEDLLIPMMGEGKRLSASPSLEQIRARARAQVGALHPTIRRLLNPHEYPVGLDARLQERRLRMVEEARKKSKR